MIIESIHLRIVAALAEFGTLTEAANRLFLSQSALSHQIRHLEQKLGTAVWKKAGRRLKLTPAGEQILDTARRVLPLLEQTERTLKAYAEGKVGILRIGVECYPCYEWLTGVIGDYLRVSPEVEIDIAQQFQFSGLQGLLARDIDLLITPDPGALPQLDYRVLFDYELVLLVGESHPLAALGRVEAPQLADETLITFPVAPERLDILTEFLWPAGVQPKGHRTVASIEIMLQLTAFQRGVCALPRWLANRYRHSLPVLPLSLGAGLNRSLFAVSRREDASLAYLHRFIDLGTRSPGD